MKDTGAATSADRDTLYAQITRLSHSSILHGSESLCKLLRYLADHSLDSPGVPLKEYQIATEVFGRAADFDPRLDATVRVQTGRLRSKLAEYYTGEGASDRLVVEIPKGSYALTYHMRPVPEEPLPAPPPLPPAAIPVREELPAAPPAATRQKLAIPFSWFLLSVLTGALVVVAIAFAVTRFMMAQHAEAVSAEGPAPALRAFWAGFLSGPDAPLVVYSNAEFVGRPETGLRYYDSTRDQGQTILDHYTGVGEVMAVQELDRLFFGFERTIRVKRGRLLTWDDPKISDLVFIGSPSENLSLRDLPGKRDFVFGRKPNAPRQGDLMVQNLHPSAGEQDGYLASETPITEDYALVAVTSGLNPGRRVMILAGITTFGTQAAVEYVCRASRVDELLSRLGPAARRKVPPFEALLRVKISGGVPVESELVALHPHLHP